MRIVEGRVRMAASDVANFLACEELTQLGLGAVRGTLRPPGRAGVREASAGMLDVGSGGR